MRKLLISGVFGGVLLVGGSLAFGVPYTDIVYVDQVADGESANSVTGTFNIVNPGSSSYTLTGYNTGNGTYYDKGGYVPGTPISDATVSIFIRDSSGYTANIIINLKNTSGTTEQTYTGMDSGNNPYSVDFGFAVDNTALSVLESTGTLNWRVLDSGTGNYTVEYALLQANWTGTALAPDGGITAGLLGLAIIAMATIRRRFAVAK